MTIEEREHLSTSNAGWPDRGRVREDPLLPSPSLSLSPLFSNPLSESLFTGFSSLTKHSVKEAPIPNPLQFLMYVASNACASLQGKVSNKRT